MAKFCTNCGKELNEKGVCVSCEKSQIKSDDFVGMLKGFLQIVKGILVKPIDTLKSNCNENNFKIALISIGVTGLTMGIFLMVLMKELGASIMSIFTGGYSISNYLYGGVTLDIPYVQIFVVSFIVIIALIFACASVGYLIVEKILKGKTSIKKMITLFGFASIILSVGLLLSTLCLFINFSVALFVIGFASALWNYYIFKGTEFISSIDINKLGYAMVTSILVTSSILCLIATKILN